MKIDKKSVGQYITLIRKTLGLTMEEFGKKVNNASKGIVSNWENGVSLPNNERLTIIAKLGNIDVQDILYNRNAEFYEPMKQLFNISLEKHDMNTVIGKALRFFDEDERIKILKLAIKNILSSSAYSSKTKKEIWDNIKKTNYKNIFYIHMLTLFEDEYVNHVKTNWNILSKSLSYTKNLQNYNKNYNYTKRNKSLQFSISDTEKADINYYETKINPKLLGDIEEILQETTMKLKKLFDEYPEKEEKKGIDIAIIQCDTVPNDNLLKQPKSSKIANIIDGVNTLESSNISIDEGVKEKIIEIAKANERFF